MRHRLFERIRSERGVAIPTVLFVTIVGMAVATVGITASISSQRGTLRDQERKEAIAAADSAVNLALFRINKVATTDAVPCVVVGALGDLLPGLGLSDGWCPAASGTVGDATYTYRVKPPTPIGVLLNQNLVEIVGVGTSGGVTRRVETRATANTGRAIFGNAAVIGDESIDILGNSGVGVISIGTNVASNGTVTLDGSAVLCGDAAHGAGHSVVVEGSASQCPGFAQSEQNTNIPVPDPGDVHAINSNGRFFSQDPRHPNSDTGVKWVASSRTLTMKGNSDLTLGGSNYSICRLVMEGNSLLIAAQGVQATLWFDTPENCNLPSGTEQISLTGNSKIAATSGDPNSIRMVLEGSDERQTIVNLNGNTQAQNEVVIYAPRSDVVLQGNATYKGAFAGKTVTIQGSPTVLKLDNLTGIDIPALIHYTRDRYVECTGVAAAGQPPDIAC